MAELTSAVGTKASIHFEKNLFENSLMPHLTQQLLLPFLLHVHKPFNYMQPLLFLDKVAQVRQQEEEEARTLSQLLSLAAILPTEVVKALFVR